jgi:hypothetical protein
MQTLLEEHRRGVPDRIWKEVFGEAKFGSTGIEIVHGLGSNFCLFLVNMSISTLSTIRIVLEVQVAMVPWIHTIGLEPYSCNPISITTGVPGGGVIPESSPGGGRTSPTSTLVDMVTILQVEVVAPISTPAPISPTLLELAPIMPLALSIDLTDIGLEASQPEVMVVDKSSGNISIMIVILAIGLLFGRTAISTTIM